ncbi:hydroxylamine reductase [Terrimicrobium sacchariphilum]|uniref:Hydroxylamine reductase n=1 Tax=Terrimicrobium sacchariphilum TaxID=690879 RepID=A0A146GB22_TERSA|nr:hydroxylamine reductase [Terrimicrobium sacchariphilum]GAT34433.1 hydroxylamine reductase [Terrimicrobium sacchariphilum]
MFCFQCQESANNSGCTIKGVCGKPETTAALQDLLVYTLKGIAVYVQRLADLGQRESAHTDFVIESLFSTITNANWDDAWFVARIEDGQYRLDQLDAQWRAAGAVDTGDLPDCATWRGDATHFARKAQIVGILAEPDEDIRSLRELLITGIKGIAAYAKHAGALGYRSAEVDDFFYEGLEATTRSIGMDQLIALVMKAGAVSVTAMALLDNANTSTFGHPEITQVNIGVGQRPGILISGHDLKDIGELLEQSKDAGVDIYTHGEMLPAHYYPAFKKYPHFVGNYGGAWWQQTAEFEAFNGPVLLTTNCLVPLRSQNTYLDRLYTTGAVGYPGAKHIPVASRGGAKDFSAIIAQAKTCAPPRELETGTIVGGFAHNQVLSLADKVLDAVNSRAIERFVVLAGCDGRHSGRSYYTEVAQKLPQSAVILTAGCAKFRYNKLDLGNIGGIPRVLDAGQCNDSYSLVMIALKLKEVLGLADINDLPISYDIAWYEQKAVCVLLALLHLGVKGIRLGPSLPAFLSPNVAKFLVETFDIKTIGTPEEDIDEMMTGMAA